jgi:hypothetical protein
MAWAELIARGNGEGIDATNSYDSKIRELTCLYEESVEPRSDNKTLLPTQLKLEPAYPNPFNSTTSICYQLSVNSEVTLKIFDISGREVVTLVNGKLNAGYHTVAWEANVPSGIYICRMEAGSFSKSIKLVLNR